MWAFFRHRLWSSKQKNLSIGSFILDEPQDPCLNKKPPELIIPCAFNAYKDYNHLNSLCLQRLQGLQPPYASLMYKNFKMMVVDSFLPQVLQIP